MKRDSIYIYIKQLIFRLFQELRRERAGETDRREQEKKRSIGREKGRNQRREEGERKEKVSGRGGGRCGGLAGHQSRECATDVPPPPRRRMC